MALNFQQLGMLAKLKSAFSTLRAAGGRPSTPMAAWTVRWLAAMAAAIPVS